MSDISIELLKECIDKDKENVINKIDNIELLKELYQTYLQYYSFFNSEFDSFNAKLSNLSTLVTVLLGFLLTIATFLFENEYLKSINLLNGTGIFLAILTFVLLLYLLIMICRGQSFKTFLTLRVDFPLVAISDSIKESDESVYYKKLVFCLYKTVRINYHNLEENKTKFPYTFNIYIWCVIISVISLVLTCIGSIIYYVR